MNAWTIYWILQLDSINTALSFMSWGFLIALAVTMLAGAMASDLGTTQTDSEKALWAGAKRTGSRLAAACFVSLVAVTLVPTTKTAAAMTIVPAIANNETIRKESGELYGLAKQALREAVTDKAKDAAKEVAK